MSRALATMSAGCGAAREQRVDDERAELARGGGDEDGHEGIPSMAASRSRFRFTEGNRMPRALPSLEVVPTLR